MAAIVTCRVARAQGFTEGTSARHCLARWLLDRNGVQRSARPPPEDREIADILVKSASGPDVENNAALYKSRRHPPAEADPPKSTRDCRSGVGAVGTPLRDHSQPSSLIRVLPSSRVRTNAGRAPTRPRTKTGRWASFVPP